MHNFPIHYWSCYRETFDLPQSWTIFKFPVTTTCLQGGCLNLEFINFEKKCVEAKYFLVQMAGLHDCLSNFQFALNVRKIYIDFYDGNLHVASYLQATVVPHKKICSWRDHLSSSPAFWLVRVLVFYVVFCRSLFACYFDIVLSVFLRFTASHYPFCIFKSFFALV